MFSIALFGAHKNKNKEEPKPQTLPLPKELPMALAADTQNLTFRNTPLLSKGRLSAQIKNSLEYLVRETRGESIVKMRAFVSGAGDSRRVKALVSEMFSEKKLSLPVLTIVQVGSVGNNAAGIAIESVISGKKAENPNGLAFLPVKAGHRWRPRSRSFKPAFVPYRWVLRMSFGAPVSRRALRTINRCAMP